MDQMAEDQLDFEDDEYGGAQKHQYQGAGGAISALADEEPMGDDDDYDDLYNDVNVGEGFLQMHRSEVSVPPGGVSNGAKAQKISIPERREEIQGSQETSIPGVSSEGKYSSAVSQYPGPKEGLSLDKKPEVGSMAYPDGASGSQKGRMAESGQDTQARRMGFQGSVSVTSDVPVKVGNEPVQQMNSGGPGLRGASQMLGNQTHVNVNHQVVIDNQMRPPMENGSTMLFVGELHWWTTDAELENVLSQYGRVKEIKFYDERASGKSKGYCQVEFFDAGAAAACKEGMHGHDFNGRPCVVAFASPQTLKQMGAAYANKNPIQNQSQPQGRRPSNEGMGRGSNQNFQSGDGGRNFGRGGWGGRGGQGVLNRGPGTGGPMRGRGGAMGAKNMVNSGPGVGGGAGGAGGYGQGLPGPAFGGPAGAMMNPQAMMASGFDPTYMGRGAGYGGFTGPAFPGMLPSFPGVNPMGLAAVAPHVNPAFFGRGMAANGMGMMGGSSLMEGHHGGMWNDPSMGGWGGGEEHGRRTRESSYGGDDASDYGYGDTNHEKGGRSSGVSRERERGPEREWSGNSERRHHDDRDQDYNRPEKEQREHRYREDKDGYRDNRQKDRDMDYDGDWDKGQSSSRPRGRSRVVAEDHHRSRSRDIDYGKRRRLPSE